MTVVRYRVPAPGSAWLEDDRVETALVLQIDGAARPHTRVRTIRKRVEVFGATAQVVTRARISYLEHAVVEQLDLRERRIESPLAGRAFVLDASSGALVVTAGDGAPVSPDDEARVRAAEKRFGGGDSLPSVVARLAVRPGEPVAVPAALAARLFGGSDTEVTTLELTFVEHRDDEAAFAMVLAMRQARAGSVTETAVAGALRLETATAQLRALHLVGTVHVTGATTAEGTVAMATSRTAAGD